MIKHAISKKTLLFFFMILIFWWMSVDARWDGPEKGPLHTKNQSPPYLMFLTPVPDAPELVPFDKFSASMAIDYSSAYLYAQSNDWYALIDMELMILDFFMEYRASKNLSIMANLCLVDMERGFMDPLLEDYHSLFDFQEYGRSYRPNNTFGYNLTINDDVWIQSQNNGLQPADSTISVKFLFLDENTTGFLNAGLSYFLKVPMGDTTEGLGSGAFDHGLFLLTRTRARNLPFVFYLNTGFILLSDPKTSGPDVMVDNVYSFLICTEYIMSKTRSLLIQLNCFESPFHDTGIRMLEKDIMELSIGVAWNIRPDIGFEVAFCEDLSQNGTPDFTIHGRIYHYWDL